MRLPKPLLRADPNVNKYDFGHVLVVAGSAPMLGAAVLTATAAMRTGAGLVTCAIPKELNLALQCKLPAEIMTLPFNSYADIANRMHKFDVLAIGPGLGQDDKTEKLVKKLLLGFNKPMVIDAEALNIIARDPDILLRIKAVKVLTPHEGEMARLLSATISEVQRNRKKSALDFATKYNAIVVLKGQGTLVVSQYGKVYTNKTGNPAMAKAGVGDVLTGIIAGLLAQSISDMEAVKFAVYYHSHLADKIILKSNHYSLTAFDIIGMMKMRRI